MGWGPAWRRRDVSCESRQPGSDDKRQNSFALRSNQRPPSTDVRTPIHDLKPYSRACGDHLHVVGEHRQIVLTTGQIEIHAGVL